MGIPFQLFQSLTTSRYLPITWHWLPSFLAWSFGMACFQVSLFLTSIQSVFHRVVRVVFFSFLLFFFFLIHKSLLSQNASIVSQLTYNKIRSLSGALEGPISSPAALLFAHSVLATLAWPGLALPGIHHSCSFFCLDHSSLLGIFRALLSLPLAFRTLLHC